MPISLKDIQGAEESARQPGVRLSDADIARVAGTNAALTAEPGAGLRARNILSSYDVSRQFLGRRTPEGGVEFAPEGTLPLLGEVAGSFAPGPLKYLAGPAGAGAGVIAESYLKRGQAPPAEAVLKEIGLSAIGDIGEGVLRGAGRQLLRNTPGGKAIRFDEAAREARELPGLSFEPLPEARIAAMFEGVNKAGVKVDAEDISGYLHDTLSGKVDELASEVSRIDRVNKTGGRFRQGFDALRAKDSKITGVRIDQLQQLSSELRKRINKLPESYEARQLMMDFRETIDDTLFNAPGRGAAGAQAPQAQALLAEARKQYARSKAAEELGDLIEKHVSSTPDLSLASFNVRGMANELRRGTSSISKHVNRALELTPGAKDRFDDSLEAIAKEYGKLEFSMADTSGFRRLPLVAGLGRMLSTAMLTDSGRELFTQAVLHGRGTISPNLLGAAANAGRRELFPSEEGGTR